MFHSPTSQRAIHLFLVRSLRICTYLFLLILTLAAAGSQAPPRIDAATSFAGGSGTQIDPYLVATADHLNSVYLQDVNLQTPYTDVSGVITSNTTWTLTNSPYQVSGDVTVAEGITLTIESGVRVEFGLYTGLYVDGQLQALGSETVPITFTGTTEEAGWWGGINVRNQGSAELAHVAVGYAGYNGYGIRKRGSGSLSVQHATIHNSSGDGLQIEAGYSSFTYAHNTYRDNSRYGIYVGIGTSFDDDTSTFSGNGTDVSLQCGIITQAVTWNLNPSYAFQVGPCYLFDDSGGVVVAEGGRLDILPGTVLKFVQRSSLYVDGQLQALGSETLPITFTGSTEQVGWWYGINVHNQGSAELAHVAVGYAGYAGSAGIHKSGGGSLSVQHATIHNTSGDGLRIHAGYSSFTSAYNTYRDNSVSGVTVGIGASFDDDTSTFSGNGTDVSLQCGIITQAVTWNLNPSYAFQVGPGYFFDDDYYGRVTVAEGGRLDILPGTVLKFVQRSSLYVDGQLQALGSETLPITLTGSTEQTNWWRRIDVRNQGSAELAHVAVGYAGFGGYGIRKSGSGSLSMEHATIHNTSGDGLRVENSTGHHDIARNLFTANSTGVLVQNQEETLFLTNNLIEGNTNFGVRNLNSATVYACYNWWGDASGPQHATMNPEGQGDAVTDGVLFEPWKVIRTVDFIVDVSASPVEGGSVTGGGQYEHGQTVVITATANSGYSFVHWSEDDVEVATDPVYIFSAESNRTLVAHFSLNSYTIAVSAEPSAGGTVSGGGSYDHGATVIVTATANSGYTFVNWTDEGTPVSTDPVYSFTAGEDRTLVAHFSLNSYTIAVSAEPSAGGTVSGGGSYDHGATVIVTATANSGYGFVHWSEDDVEVATDPVYSFSAESNRTLVAHFSLNRYSVDVSASPVEGGSVTGGGQYEHGQTVVITATANSGYSFVHWSEDDVEVATDPVYSFTAGEDRTLVAHFSLNSYTIAVSAEPSAGGTVSGGGSYDHGATVIVTATANSGYSFVHWSEDDVEVATDPVYIFSAEGDRTLVAHFTELEQEIHQIYLPNVSR